MYRRFSAILLPIVIPVTLSTTVEAATIEAFPLNSGEQALVTVSGPFEYSDIEQFRTKTSALSGAIVSFESDGGNLEAGIEIGQMIRLKGFVTAVPDGSRCASACALAWLGGPRRFMAKTAQVGFHAAYVVKEGISAETSAGNALVGAYLNRIGLPDRAVFYITNAAPQEMTWLSLEDAEKEGIDVDVIPQDLTTPGAPKPNNSSDKPNQTSPLLHARAAMLVATSGDPQKPAVNLGSVVWSAAPANPGQPGSSGVRAEVEIPHLKMHATMILRKNVDASLPTSHTIDLRVTFDEGSPIKGIKDIGLPQMRCDDPPATTALAGVRVKINDGYFLICLNRADADIARNVEAIGSLGWFDFPMLLSDDRIAKLTIEKGLNGERIVVKTLSAWKRFER